MNQTRNDAERNIEALYGWPETWPAIERMSDTTVLNVAGEQLAANAAGGSWSAEASPAGRALEPNEAPAAPANALVREALGALEAHRGMIADHHGGLAEALVHGAIAAHGTREATGQALRDVLGELQAVAETLETPLGRDWFVQPGDRAPEVAALSGTKSDLHLVVSERGVGVQVRSGAEWGWLNVQRLHAAVPGALSTALLRWCGPGGAGERAQALAAIADAATPQAVDRLLVAARVVA